MLEYLIDLATEARAYNPKWLAEQLQLILEGSVVIAQCGCGDKNNDTAKKMAEHLIFGALAK